MKFIPFVTLIGALATSQVSHAQEQHLIKQVSSVQLSIYYPSVHYSYENKWGNKGSYEIRVGIDGDYKFRSYAGGYKESVYSFSPSLDLGYKYYYNIQKRSENGKNTTHNSANFLSVSLLTTIGEYSMWRMRFEGERYKINDFNSRVEFSLIPKWGFKRKLGEHMGYNIQLGSYISSNLANLSLGIYAHAGFSYVFK